MSASLRFSFAVNLDEVRQTTFFRCGTYIVIVITGLVKPHASAASPKCWMCWAITHPKSQKCSNAIRARQEAHAESGGQVEMLIKIKNEISQVTEFIKPLPKGAM
eukprot:TRINITY_DN6015_c0_g1_i3.p1 TRINITY_DN6015_c0_g1~~TRINITY_DN6015_c0_g1_i3.p1  ORF type:complete len:105 (-),score=10.06 TRINITY_DN6015_c0_g1_i3:95-409(-)